MHVIDTLIATYVVNALWQAPLVLALACIAATFARRTGVNNEHRVWVAALLLQSALPLLSLANLPVAEWIAAFASVMMHVVAVGHTQGITVTVGAFHPRQASTAWGRALHVATLMYVATVAICALRLLRNLIGTWTLERNARFVPHSRSGDVRIGVSRAIGGPVAIGIARGTVLVPLGWRRSISRDDFAAAFAHETAHIARHDFAKNLFYELLACPLLLHPAVWIVRRRLAETREMVCDELASRALATPLDYARSLLRLATASMELRPTPTSHYGIGIFDAGILERRIMQLTHPRFRPQRSALAAVVLGTLFLTTAVSALALAVRVDGPTAPLNPQADKPVPMPPGAMTLTHQVDPQYPPDARKKKISGTVVLHAIIGKDGHVVSLRIDSGPKEFYASAIDATKQWTWQPYLVNGKPVEVDTHISVNYAIF